MTHVIDYYNDTGDDDMLFYMGDNLMYCCNDTRDDGLL